MLSQQESNRQREEIASFLVENTEIIEVDGDRIEQQKIPEDLSNLTPYQISKLMAVSYYNTPNAKKLLAAMQEKC